VREALVGIAGTRSPYQEKHLKVLLDKYVVFSVFIMIGFRNLGIGCAHKKNSITLWMEQILLIIIRTSTQESFHFDRLID